MITLDIETEAEGWATLSGFEALCGQAAEAVGARSPPTSSDIFHDADPSPAGEGGLARQREPGGVETPPVEVPPHPGRLRRPGPPPPGRDRGAEPGRELTATVLLADDAAVRRLNRDWRAKDRPTNVLSFPAPPDVARATGHLGDVVLAWETVRREADDEGKPVRDHAVHLVAHGLLHLLGYDHEAEAEADAMERLEADVLARLGIADPYREPA